MQKRFADGVKRAPDSGYVRFGKRAMDSSYVRFGKRAKDSGYVRFGKRAPDSAYVRFGKRSFGGDDKDGLDCDTLNLRTLRDERLRRVWMKSCGLLRTARSQERYVR